VSGDYSLVRAPSQVGEGPRNTPWTSLAPGESTQRAITIPAETPPGTYRVEHWQLAVQCYDMLGNVGLPSPSFEVLAP
jgi:hypothetical protein